MNLSHSLSDEVVPDLPDNSVKEHLSIVNCGHDVGSGRSVMEGQKVTSAYVYAETRVKVVLDLPDNSGKEHLAIVNCGHDDGSGPTITIELVNLIISMVGNDSRIVASERTIFFLK